MSIQAIGAIATTLPVTDQTGTAAAMASGSLDEMMTNQKVATQGLSPMTEMTGDIEDVYSWLTDREMMMQNDPQRLKTQLLNYIKNFKNPEGGNVYNSLEKINTFVASLSNYFDANERTDMVDFLHNIRVELIGTDFFMRDFVQKAMFPTVENGGKFLDWDEA